MMSRVKKLVVALGFLASIITVGTYFDILPSQPLLLPHEPKLEFYDFPYPANPINPKLCQPYSGNPLKFSFYLYNSGTATAHIDKTKIYIIVEGEEIPLDLLNGLEKYYNVEFDHTTISPSNYTKVTVEIKPIRGISCYGYVDFPQIRKYVIKVIYNQKYEISKEFVACWGCR